MNVMNKSIFLAGVALAAIAVSGVAGAADLPTKKAPPAPMAPIAPAYSWTGFYVGATVGGIWGSGSATYSVNQGNNVLGSLYAPTSLGSGTSGWEGGGEIGYNYQIGQTVVGAESDLEWVTNSKSVSYSGAVIPGFGNALTTTDSVRLNWLGTTRGRLGIAMMDQNRLLLFVTGGLAYGGGSASTSVVAPNGAGWYGSNSATQVGYSLGAGAEYAITNNVTLKAEYLYYNLSSYNYTTTPNNAAAQAAGLNFASKVEPAGSIARVGVNYKF